MRTSDFDYALPADLIAQQPAPRRDASRLLVLDRATGAHTHRVFADLPACLAPGDLLVVNDSRVVPARLRGRRQGGGAVELLLLRELGDGGTSNTGTAGARRHRGDPRGEGLLPERQGEAGQTAALEDAMAPTDTASQATTAVWLCLARPAKRLRAGHRLEFGGGLRGEVREVRDEGQRVIAFHSPDQPFMEALSASGELPLPPYIHERPADPERYQTVYARVPGSVAAPTAGLHFTPELLDALHARGVAVRAVTLHVGLGTFRPVQTERIDEHRMHAEYGILPVETARAIEETRARGGRVIATGTTAMRVLESAARAGSPLADGLRPWADWTDIFIYPGFRFQVCDGLITNFHLPRSTLLMLVSAFAGKERIERAYAAAIAARYRFFSFGDAMLIL